MSNIYVVMGTTGEYSDRNEWAVMAYMSRERADKHADDAKKWAHNFFIGRESRYFDGRKVSNPFDPDMQMDYTGTDYYIMIVKLGKENDNERT